MATESLTTAKLADVGLKREMGLIGLTWASEGSIIGSGWLFASLGAYSAAGSAAIYAWIFAAVVLTILALIHAELGAMYPVAGGTARFPHYAFGTLAGASFGWFSWLQAATVAPIEVLAVEGYASYYWPALINSSGTNKGLITPLGYVIAVVLMAVFVGINFLGIKWLARVNSTATWWKIAIPVFAIIILAFKFHGSNFTAGGGFMPHGIKGVLEAVSASGIVFALLGFEQADQLAAEARNPQRDLPRAIIAAMIIGGIIYLLLQIVFIGALPASQVTNGASSITNIAIINGPFAGLAGAVALGWLAVILRVDAVISPSGTGLIYTTSASRVSYGLARNRYYPPIFGRTDSRGVPWFGLVFAFAVGLLVFLPFPSWNKLVGFVTSASVLMYAAAPLAVAAFRKQVPEASRPYRLPAVAVLAPLGFVVANLIIYWSGWTIIWRLGIAIVLGYVLIGINMALDAERPKLDVKSAVWLPVYLIGMGVISWKGQFGFDPTVVINGKTVTNPLTGHIPFWYDIGVVAVFSLIIYYWAVWSRLSRDEMLGYVGTVDVVDEAPGTVV
jgi:amino acid transporter